MFTLKQKNILLKLISNEQLKHMITNNEYESDEYRHLEELKVKIRTSEVIK